MYPRRILLSLCLLCFLAGGRSEPQLAFSVPGLLQSGDTARGCLEVKYHTEAVQVNVFLEVNGVNYTIVNKQVQVTETFMCADFLVPSILKSVPVFITVQAVCKDFNHESRRPVVISPKINITFIQVDKYLCKPGDTVRFYVFTLQPDMTPMEETYSSISITDPAGNRLIQWKNRTTVNGFLPLSFTFLGDQAEGRYNIITEGQSSRQATKQIMVEDYNLPKFSVNIEAANSITILDKSISYNVTATYTYGKGVPGNVTARICRPLNYYDPLNSCNRNPDGLCFLFKGNLDINGQFSGELDLQQFQLDRSGYQMSLKLEVTVEEEGTDSQITETKYIGVSTQMARVYFTNSFIEYYKNNIDYPVEVAVEDGLGRPSSNQEVEIQVEGKLILSLITDADGKARGELDTSNFTQPRVNIQAVYKNAQQCYDSNWIVPTYANDYRQVTRFYSRTESYIQISRRTEELQCGNTYNLKVQYVFGKDCLKEGETTPNFIYMVTSKAKIMENGKHPVNVLNSMKGEFNITLKVTSDHAPGVGIIVYYLSRNEVVADFIHLNIENCFKNKVALSFSKNMGIPGSNVNLNINAAANSFCGSRIMDASLLLLNQGQQMNAQTVYSARPYNSLSGYYFEGYSVEPDRPLCISGTPIKVNGLYYTPIGYPEEGDAYGIFSAAGMTIAGSNFSLFKPEICGQSFSGGRPFFPTLNMAMMDQPMFTSAFARGEAAPVGTPNEVNSVRIDFRDVWYFDFKDVGESGSASVPLKVPGTITGWKGDMICLSKKDGIGMTKYPANFTSFQEFFAEVSIANKIVRGETLVVNVFLSNYLKKCVKVRANISQSDDYTAAATGDHSVQCICSGRRASYTWTLKAKNLGMITVNVTGETIWIGDSCEGPADTTQTSYKDTMVQTVIVEAEGIETEVTDSRYFCVNGTDKLIPLSIPFVGTFVPGSLKPKFITIGDILGRAVTNPESMIREPTGCGEQTISTLMLLPIVVRYLQSTNRLTEEMKNRAIQYMEIGYRRMLSFWNTDGSFNAFGSGQNGGSARLTIRVLETFHLCAKYIDIEERVMNQIVIYLGSLQDLATGRFIARGYEFNSALQGDDVGFTALVVAVLHQHPYASSASLLPKALGYLSANSEKDLSPYNMALMYYAFQVAGDVKSDVLFERLKTIALNDGGTIHWDRSFPPKKQTPVYMPAASAEIEITSIVLLAMTKKKSPSPEDLAYMSSITLYLTRNQNSYGSYSTSSDTSVALQALSGFGLLTYQKDANNAVQLNDGANLIRKFNIDGDNRILLQTEPLPTLYGNYSITLSGKGCVLVQTAVQYNIPVQKANGSFSLSVETSPKSCDAGVLHNIHVTLNVSYDGEKNQSNMALIDFPLPSGYSLEYSSLVQLRQQAAKVELTTNHVIIYLNSVSNNASTFHLTLQMGAMVFNLQPTTIKVWDYYEKRENGAAVFYHPCSKIQ